MKACPKCQTKNQESSGFCKKCGLKFDAPSFQDKSLQDKSLQDKSFRDKREKVMGETGKKSSWMLVAAAVLVVGLAASVYWLFQGQPNANPQMAAQPEVTGKADYTGQTIRMTDIPIKVEKGKISIPADVVVEKKIVRFEYEGPGGKIPLLAYISPSGKVVTAVSMCEPCKSTRFHIQAKTLVCNACYTEWNLETLKGIKGGCMDYPPEVIPSVTEKGQILIDEKIVIQWKPRV